MSASPGPVPPADDPGLDDPTVATALGQSPGLIDLWRGMGIRWFFNADRTRVETWSSGVLVGYQEVTADGRPYGAYVTVVSRLSDQDLARRDLL